MEFLCLFKMQDSGEKLSEIIRLWIEFLTTWHILNWRFDNVSDSELNFLQHVRFSIFHFLRTSLNLNPRHKLFATFSSNIPREITAYNIFILEIIAVAVQTITLVLIFTRIFNVVFTLLSHFFLCMDWIFAKFIWH